MRTLNALPIAAVLTLVLAGCGPSAQPGILNSCDEVIAAVDERSGEFDDILSKIDGLTSGTALRVGREREAIRNGLAANHLVVDNSTCFSPGEVADAKANIAVLESQLP